MWSPNLAHLIPVAERMHGRPGAKSVPAPQPMSSPAFAGREWGDGMRVTNTHKRSGGLRGEQRQFRLRRVIAEKFCRVRRAAVKVEVTSGWVATGHMLSLIEFRL